VKLGIVLEGSRHLSGAAPMATASIGSGQSEVLLVPSEFKLTEALDDCAQDMVKESCVKDRRGVVRSSP